MLPPSGLRNPAAIPERSEDSEESRFANQHPSWSPSHPLIRVPSMRKKRFDGKGNQRRKATREDDATYRLTHLWAASHLLSEASPTLSRFYVSTSRQICRRINLKTDSVTIKRCFCKKCNALLIPGVGTPPPTVRHSNKREKYLVVTCGNCSNSRRFLSRKPGRASDCPASTRPAPPNGAQLPAGSPLPSGDASSNTEQTTLGRKCILQ